jgi:uncharacterized protein (DUF433 family)
MSQTAAFTAAEVAFVLREPIKAVKKALDDGPVEARLVRKPGGAVRAVEWPDLLYLYVVRSLREELTPKARNQLYHALKSTEVEHTQEIRFGRLSVAISDLRAEVEKRARELTALAEKIEFRTDGEPVLKGTDIEVHRIASLLAGGIDAGEICEDYPSLKPKMVDVARAYAEAHPKSGRPYPSRTVKRALKNARLEALDEVLDEDR